MSYLDVAFQPDLLVERYKKHVTVEPDLLVGTGVSGATSVAALGARLGLPYAVIRKKGVRCHSPHVFEGPDHLPDEIRWLFVDDLVDTGKTLRRVAKHMYCRPIGVFLFGSDNFCSANFVEGERLLLEKRWRAYKPDVGYWTGRRYGHRSQAKRYSSKKWAAKKGMPCPIPGWYI